LDDMAILVRASHQMRAFEDRFLTIGLPYRVIGGPRFYERMEIRDAMAYFRLSISQDDDLAFERIYNKPKRGLGDKAFQKIQMAARESGVSLTEGSRLLLAAGDLGGKGAKELQKLLDGLDRWHKLVVDGRDHIELAEIIIDESEYPEMYMLPAEADKPRKARDAEAAGRLENLKELIKALEGFDNLQGFLEHVSLVMDNANDDEDEKVSIMTLHAAKGLEFPAVFLPGWEDGLFPSQRAMDESGLKGLEEERRLAYVGLTRAEEYAVVSFAQNRFVFGSWQSQMASRFIDEMDADAVEVLGAAGQHAAAEVQSDIYERASRADSYNSPGWKRLQERQNQRGMSQPRESRNVVIDMNAVSAFTTGERVFHDKFGYGTITAIEGDKLDISFEKAGFKKVVAKFVKAAEAADDVPF
ncbi:MAG: 3'-5' exonuclease, partial [Pseudomonadota bacterium]